MGCICQCQMKLQITGNECVRLPKNILGTLQNLFHLLQIFCSTTLRSKSCRLTLRQTTKFQNLLNLHMLHLDDRLKRLHRIIHINLLHHRSAAAGINLNITFPLQHTHSLPDRRPTAMHHIHHLSLRRKPLPRMNFSIQDQLPDLIIYFFTRPSCLHRL